MEKVTVKIILDKGVEKPMYMTEGAAGMDVRANITAVSYTHLTLPTT